MGNVKYRICLNLPETGIGFFSTDINLLELATKIYRELENHYDVKLFKVEGGLSTEVHLPSKTQLHKA